MSEKIGGAKGTELDDDFIQMEKVWTLLYLGFRATHSLCRAHDISHCVVTLIASKCLVSK